MFGYDLYSGFTPQKDAVRQRTARILTSFIHTKPHLSVERARLFTQSYRTTEHLPMALRWALALTHVLRNIEVHILPDELLVGRAAPKGLYGIFYPELEGAYFSMAGTLLEQSEAVPHQFTPQDIAVIRDELLPYWAGRTFRESLAYTLPEDVKRMVYGNGDIYTSPSVIYETATARHSMQWVLDFGKVITRGFSGIAAEARELLGSLDINDPEHNFDKVPFYRAVILLCEAVRDYAERHADLALQLARQESDGRRKAELERIAATCRRVPWLPAETFREGLQAQWFTQLISRYEQMHGGIVGNGRLDQYMFPLYCRDLERGLESEDTYLELLDSLWLNTVQFVHLQPTVTGIQYFGGHAHWGNTTIGGVLPDGTDASNDLTRLLCRSLREFPLSYPGLSFRVHKGTSDDLLHEIAGAGGGGRDIPTLLNDEEIVPLLVSRGASPEEARDYCASGGSEARLINRTTYLTGSSWFNLAAVLEMALYNGRCSMQPGAAVGLETGDSRNFAAFADFEAAFYAQLDYVLHQVMKQQYLADVLRPNHMAAPLLSLLHDLCMRQGRDICSGTFAEALPIGGLISPTGFATVIDSLSAVRSLVYERRILSMEALLDALRRNFEGRETARLYCGNAPKYGNQITEVDALGLKMETFMVTACERHTNYYGGHPQIAHAPVNSHVAMGRATGATPNGRRAGEALSGGVCPSAGASREGMTALFHSAGATKYEQGRCRASRKLDINLASEMGRHPDGQEYLVNLIKSWRDQRHWHLHIHLTSEIEHRLAANEPEKLRFQPVYVPGYCALPKDGTTSE